MLLNFPPPESKSGWLLLDLATKLGNRIPNAKPPPRHPDSMEAAKEIVLEKHPNAQLRSLGSEYNCAGMVFGARRTVIEAEDVAMILHEDGYHPLQNLEELMIGDVVVYKIDQHTIAHVGIIASIETTVSPPSRNICVLSQWGRHGEYLHDIDDVDPRYGNLKEFWTDRL